MSFDCSITDTVQAVAETDTVEAQAVTDPVVLVAVSQVYNP